MDSFKSTVPGHIVYPCGDDRRLVDAAGFFTASGLRNDGAVIIITTEDHQHAIERYLKSDGNVKPLEQAGQLTFLDAEELLDTVMVTGRLDPKVFNTGLGH